ncbi:MAG: hypothetical protein Q9187_008547 [Circinaria calcarea]
MEASQAPFRGPPRIIEHIKSNPPPLLSDIKAYRLSTEIDFPELQLHALGRMYAWHETHDDPFEILEWIYFNDPAQDTEENQDEQEDANQSKNNRETPFQPDSNLRKWVKDWLKVPSGLMPYPCNLQTLQRNPAWKDNYVRHQERNSELVTDVEVVQAELRERLTPQYARLPTQLYAQPVGYVGAGPYGSSPYHPHLYTPMHFPHRGYVSPVPAHPNPVPSKASNIFEPQLPYAWNYQQLPPAEWMIRPTPDMLTDEISQMWPGGRVP